jgi:hypothetical protein
MKKDLTGKQMNIQNAVSGPKICQVKHIIILK